jgi:hypothetical protein
MGAVIRFGLNVAPLRAGSDVEKARQLCSRLQALVYSAASPVERRVPTRRGWVGELSGLFEHP